MSVTIIGGGMTGATLALAISNLSKGKLEVHLVECFQPEYSIHPSFDARAIVFSQGTCRELTNIGVWPSISPFSTEITKIEISDSASCFKMSISASDYQLSAFGHVVKLQDAGICLFNRLRTAPGVKLHCPAKLTKIERDPMKSTIFLDDGQTITTQLIVAADGSRSKIGKTGGIRWNERHYQQIAVTTDIFTTLQHGNSAFEHFTSHGPLAILPIAKDHSALVWCIPETCQKEVIDWDNLQFCKELQKKFGWRLGRIMEIGERHVYRLFLRIAERRISHRLVLIGNAAQTIHPVAAQGVNLGLRDVITLAEMLVDAMQKGYDIGGYDLLLDYQKKRQLDQSHTVVITDALIRLFSNSYLPLVVFRNMMFFTIDHIPLLRNALFRKIMGGFS